MIHCVNLNATLDQLFVLPSVQWGGVNRAVATLSYPGGKGNNVARMVAKLKGKARLHAFSGASERAASARFFREQGVDARLTPVPGTSRPCLVILDGERNQETVINSPSQLKMGPAALGKLLEGLLRALKPGDIVTLSGSLPEGLKPDSYRTMIRAIQARGGVAMLDSYGPGLLHGVEAAPLLVKPNADELGATFGLPVRTREEVLEAARRLLRKGVRCVVVTLGERGALALTPRETLLASPLPTPRGLLSPVGCGDAFFGGLALGLERSLPLPDCLKLATAAAWANLSHPGAVFFDAKLVRAQMPLVKVSRLAA